MHYKIIFISIIFAILVGGCKKDNIINEKLDTDINKIVYYLEQLKPLIEEVNNKLIFDNNYKISKDDSKIEQINTLLENMLDNVPEILSFEKYSLQDYYVLRYIAKLEIVAFVSLQIKDNINKEIAEQFIHTIKLYTIPLLSLYDNKININKYLDEYKGTICDNVECLKEYQYNLQLINKMDSAIDSLHLSENDNKIRKNIINNINNGYMLLSNSHIIYSKYMPPILNIVLPNKTYYFNDYQIEYARKIYKYKQSKLLKNIHLARIYMQFIMLNDKYRNNLFNMDSIEHNYPEEFYDETSLFVSGCTNPQYLFENTLNKCVDFVKSADRNDAFAYLEDENIANFVMINDKLCAEKENDKYIFYNNDNIMCNTLKEKLNN